jgi:hypothetical protein
MLTFALFVLLGFAMEYRAAMVCGRCAAWVESPSSPLHEFVHRGRVLHPIFAD